MREPASQPSPGWPGGNWKERPDWKASLAGILSALIPGVGQLYAGRHRRGALMLLLTTVCLVAIAYLAQALRQPGAMARLVRPEALLILLLGNLLLLGFRIASAADAFWLGARRAVERGIASPLLGWRPLPVALIAVLVFTTLPHAVAAWYNVKTYEVVTSVFSSSGLGPRLGDAIAGLGREPEVTVPSMNILLLGGDAGPGRSGLRTDSMMVARIDAASGRAALFGLPRNLVRVPLPDGPAADFFGGCRCFPRPLNELYAFAEEERPDLFPGPEQPGINALADAAGELLGLEIDYFALVDLQGFVDVVDALGGVTVNVQQRVWVEIDRLGKRGGPAYFLEPGRRHLNGLTALAYSRSRDEKNEDGGNDYGRMRRQRCLLSALAAQVDPAKLLTSFNALVDVLKENVRTNVPIDLLPDLIAVLGENRPQTTTIGFAPPTFNEGWENGYPIPDARKIRRTVRETLASPPTTATPATTVPTTTRAGSGDDGPPRRRRTATTREIDPSAHVADSCGPVR